VTSHVVHLGDCLDRLTGMESLADKSIDHVITDPPYSKVVVTSSKTTRYRSAEARIASQGKTAPMHETRDLGYAGLEEGQRRAVAAHLARIARRWVIVFCDAESLSAWRTELESGGARHVRMGAWVMPNFTPQFTGDRPGTGWEAFEIAYGKNVGRMRWNGGGNCSVYEFIRTPNGTAERDALGHPSPKPLPLMEALIRDFTDPGETILDPFAGSGTTGVAAKRLGRSFIGWERDPKYHAIALKRIENTREQLRMFEGFGT